MNAELAPLRERLNGVVQALRRSVTEVEVDLPELPEPEADPDDEGWLFDTRRDYDEQFVYYKTPEELAEMQAEMEEKNKICAYCGKAFRAKTARRKFCTNSCRSQAGKKTRRSKD